MMQMGSLRNGDECASWKKSLIMTYDLKLKWILCGWWSPDPNANQIQSYGF